MQTHYTIKEAAAFTGKSESTIKRLIAPIRADDSSPDRHHLLPSPEKYAELKSAGQPFNWQIAEAFLTRHFQRSGPAATEASGPQLSDQQLRSIGSDKLVDALNKTIDILERQLTEKDRQMKEKDELINKFGGMAQELQKKLLAAPSPVGSPDRATTGERGSGPAPAASSADQPRRPKKTPARDSFANRHLPTFKRILGI